MKDQKMRMQDRIQEKLTKAFAPTVLEIIDDSESHRGHGGFIEGVQTHLNVKIRAKALNGKSRVAAQRAVLTALKQEFEDGLHALALDAKGTD